MKKIFVLLALLFSFTPVVRAQEVDLTYYLNLAQSKNIDVNEVMQRPYVGHSYEYIQKSDKPYIIVFADFTDVATATRYLNNGYFVYNNLQNQYGFSAFNVKNSENAALLKRHNVKNVPYAFVTNPKSNEILPIKPALYENPKKLVHLLKVYWRKTR